MNKRLLDLHEGKTAPAPTGAPGPQPAGAAAAGPVLLTPSDVLARAKANVEHMASKGDLHVVGEISGKKTTPQGHWTFDLKDKHGAALPCIVFFNDTRRVKLVLEQGMQIVAVGVPTVSFARVQLKVKNLSFFSKDGELDAAFRQLKAKLAAEGLFDAARKRALPFAPATVGLVTSSTGAAIRDALKVLFTRMPRLRVIISPTKVQGEGAAADVAEALRRLDATKLCDVILLVRGGGSLEDLFAFNTEPVARAIASSSTPIISGVGHETDTTIADLVADRRAATPSNAAEMAVPVLAELEHRLEGARRRLSSSLRHLLADARVRLDRQRKKLADPRPLVDRRRRAIGELDKRLERALRRQRDASHARLGQLEERLRARAPDRLLAERRARLIDLDKRLARALQQQRDVVTSQRRQLDALAVRLQPALARARARGGSAFALLVARLEAMSPLTVLARGYAIARRSDDGIVVRAPADAPAGTRLLVRVEGGELRATVDDD